MGAWAYCTECDNALDRPTFRELWEKEQCCQNGHVNVPVGSLGEFLDEFTERLIKLEKEVSRLKKQSARLRGRVDALESGQQVITSTKSSWELYDDDIPF